MNKNVNKKNSEFVILILSAVILYATNFSAIAKQSLTLDQAINLAIERNHSLALSATDTESGRLGIKAAEADFKLAITPEANLRTTGDNDETDSEYGLGLTRKFITGTEISSRVFDRTGSGDAGAVLELSQPLFRRAGRLVNQEPITQASQDLLSIQRRYELQKADLVIDVVRNFENILRLSQQVQADEKALQRAQRLLMLTQTQERLGRTTRVDTLRVELQVGQAQSRFENDSERLGSLQRELAELLGDPPEKAYQLQAASLLVVSFDSVESAIKTALSNRLDYAQILQDLDDAKRKTKIAEKGLLPDINLIARYEKNDDRFFDDSENFSDDIWLIGLSGSTDFRRSKEKVALSQAIIDESSANQRIRIAELSIARDVQQRILAYQRTHRELEILNRNLEQAQARLRLARRLFELNRGDNFTVTDAEEAFLQAEFQLLDGRASASIASYELLRSMGTLTHTPEHLKPIRKTTL